MDAETLEKMFDFIYMLGIGAPLGLKIVQYLLASCKVDLFIINEYKRQYKQAMDDLKRG